MNKGDKSLLIILLIIAIVIIIAIVLIWNVFNYATRVFSSTTSVAPTTTIQVSTAYLTQSQLSSIYGIGSYGVLNTGSTKVALNGSSLNSFIALGTNLTANFSTPTIQFEINTTVNSITVDNSYTIKYVINKNGQNKLVFVEKVLSSTQASYLFVSQAQLATNEGFVNGMQYFTINNNEIIANKNNYVLILKCEGTLCTNQTINETASAISNDSI
jgi:hypothetical protein